MAKGSDNRLLQLDQTIDSLEMGRDGVFTWKLICSNNISQNAKRKPVSARISSFKTNSVSPTFYTRATGCNLRGDSMRFFPYGCGISEGRVVSFTVTMLQRESMQSTSSPSSLPCTCRRSARSHFKVVANISAYENV